jgi:hypothetical protein
MNAATAAPTGSVAKLAAHLRHSALRLRLRHSVAAQGGLRSKLIHRTPFFPNSFLLKRTFHWG